MSSAKLSSLYTAGDLILQNPIESSAVFLVVVIMCACIEYLFTLASEINSKFFKVIFDVISEEVLVIGVLSLLLTFGSSIFSSLPNSWMVMFQWTHICLLFMGVMFVAMIIIIIVVVISGNSKWKKFEATRMQGSMEGLGGRELKYRQAWEKYTSALEAHGYQKQVSFADYLLKGEKRNLVALGNFTWKSWLALSTIVVVNALRTKLNPTHPSPTDPNVLLNESDSIIDVAGYIALAGYATLGAYLYVHFTLQRRFRQYLMLEQKSERVVAGENTLNTSEPLMKVELDDPQTFLFWQRPSSTLSILQGVVIFLVWYGAVFFLNMVYTIFPFTTYVSLAFIVAAFIPFAVFMVFIPWTLTLITILSTLGTSLNETWVQSVIEANEELRESVKVSAGLPVQAKQQTEDAPRKIVKRPQRPILLDDRSLMRLSAREPEEADIL